MRSPWFSFFFFFNDTATTEIYTLSLHDALPISLTNRADHAGILVAHGMPLSRDALRRGDELILDARLVGDDIAMDYPGLQRVRGGSALGHFHYTPILLSADRHPSRIDPPRLPAW